MSSGVLILFDSGIVTSGDVIVLQTVDERQEFSELEFPIANHTGARRSSVKILIDKVVNDTLLKYLFIIHAVERNSKLGCHSTRILNAFKRTTIRLFRFYFECVGSAEPHRYADYIAARLKHQCGCDRAVNAAAHGDDDFLR